MHKKIKVVAFKGENKFEILDAALKDSGLIANLNSSFISSGKSIKEMNDRKCWWV